MSKEEICYYVNHHDDICEGGGYLLWSRYVECQFDLGKKRPNRLIYHDRRVFLGSQNVKQLGKDAKGSKMVLKDIISPYATIFVHTLVRKLKTYLCFKIFEKQSNEKRIPQLQIRRCEQCEPLREQTA
ncbi:hypothetical protein KIN20_036781 [Parelaphostrongylus tenuis]|uniref:Uncharacterized protein n=1 Tax=Parelaphostrongylus tenuis TaxID=148309 RepID=A0AAD5RDV3_PARTN|nr:hypothetical protein KIN20_036781 [Parelaphostrongylus tenuis]